MKKKLKPILITAAVCVVLAGVIFGVIKLFPQRDNVAEQPKVDPSSGESIYIVNKAATLVESVEITPSEGDKFRILYSINDAGDQVAELKGSGEEFKYKSDELYTLAGYVGILTAIEEIDNPNGRDAEFGFNKPKRTIKVNFTDNQQVELILGADAPTGDGVYIKRKDTGRVYLIGGSTTSMLMKSQVDFRDITLYEAYTSIDTIQEVSIQRPGEEKITVRRKENAEPVTNENPTAPQYEITSPDQADATNDPVESKLLTPLIAIASESLVEDYPKDLKKYGLDNPTVISFADTSKNTHTLKVGGLSELNLRYVMCDDVPSVLTLKEDISFLNIGVTDLMNQLLWLHNQKDVAQIQYQLPSGETHVLVINTTDNGTTATYDGASISAGNATNLFMHSIQFTIQGSIDSSMKYGAPDYTLTMKLRDGSTTTLQLSRINERQYAASVDGQTPRYYVNVSQVNALAKAFQQLSSGGNVASIF